MSMVKFILVGPNAGKTIGFSKDLNGNTRYNFVEGVMEMHPTKVTGRFIKFIKKTYSAVLEGELENGERQVQENGSDSERSEDVHDGGLTEESVNPAAESAIKLSGDDKPKAGKKKRSAKRN